MAGEPDEQGNARKRQTGLEQRAFDPQVDLVRVGWYTDLLHKRAQQVETAQPRNRAQPIERDRIDSIAWNLMH